MKEYKFDYRKLKGKIVEKNQNQESISKEMRISKSTFNFKINNKYSFSQDEIINLCKILDIPKKEIVEIFFNILP